MDALNASLNFINDLLWHDWVLYTVLASGVLFTFWSGFSQFRALTHGSQVLRGRYDTKGAPGAISHFQALSTALSATVGLGNIAGVALAVTLGGPGAVFWMWVIGFFGMALKSTEVILAMLYRQTDDPENPRGGTMWVAKEGFARMGLPRLGKVTGGIFCVTLIISAITGGNMFQSWNVAEITHGYFPAVPRFLVGLVLAVLVGLVLLGGIKRIGAVAGTLVPFMTGMYLLAALAVIVTRLEDVPGMLRLIVVSGFRPTEASGAFLGGTAGFAFLWGMKRALFSSEAGQGSAPIAHAAAKSDEPVREGLVAGLEPFIDTLVVCTLTALVILLSGAWNRSPDATFSEGSSLRLAHRVEIEQENGRQSLLGSVISRDHEKVVFLNANPGPRSSPYLKLAAAEVRSVSFAEGYWLPKEQKLPGKSPEAQRISGPWVPGATVFMVAQDGSASTRIFGSVLEVDGELLVAWKPVAGGAKMRLQEAGIYSDYIGAALTGHAFDRVFPGVGMWLVTLACWLFAVSTIIGWSYYGEQGVLFLAGPKAVFPYRVGYILAVAVATLGFIRTDKQLDQWTALGTGVMLVANIPIMLVFGHQAMAAYRSYIRRLDAGEMKVGSKDEKEIPVIEGSR